MGRLLVIRHGQSTWNAAGRWQGWADPPLSALGQEQASSAGCALAAAGETFGVIASSTLRRAKHTAEIIAREIGHEQPIVVDPDLREQDMGDWSGLTRDQIEQRWPGLLGLRRSGKAMSVPGGESSEQFEQRCLGALQRLLEQPGQPVLAVCHGGVLVALEKALGAGRHPAGHANLSGWVVSDDGGELTVLHHVELAQATDQRHASRSYGQARPRPRLSYRATDGAQ